MPGMLPFFHCFMLKLEQFLNGHECSSPHAGSQRQAMRTRTSAPGRSATTCSKPGAASPMSGGRVDRVPPMLDAPAATTSSRCLPADHTVHIIRGGFPRKAGCFLLWNEDFWYQTTCTNPVTPFCVKTLHSSEPLNLHQKPPNQCNTELLLSDLLDLSIDSRCGRVCCEVASPVFNDVSA